MHMPVADNAENRANPNGTTDNDATDNNETDGSHE